MNETCTAAAPDHHQVSHSALLSVQDFLVSVEAAKHDRSGHGLIGEALDEACRTGTSLARRYNEALIVNDGVISEHFRLASSSQGEHTGRGADS